MSIEAQKSIKQGSKSFYLASFIFPKDIKEDCWALYRWCRYCDDVIDAGGTSVDHEILRQKTLCGLSGEITEEVFSDLGKVCRKHGIPNEYPLELLSGFGKDIHDVNISSEKELEKYAYQVAGVVGLMMSHLMQVNLSLAQTAAISMGNAMQLTNIARDVREDFERGRIYLPETWLREAGIQAERLLDEDQKTQLFVVIKKVLLRADELYQEGRRGLKYLPFRSALAVSVAATIYSEIGKKILRQGPSAMNSRVFVTLPRKILLTGVGLVSALAILTERFFFWRSNAKI